VAAHSKSWMMIFTLGPVQDFIARSRRTRDLWFGSYLLSEISKAAALKFRELGGELSFPAIDDLLDDTQIEQLQVANRIVGIIQTDDPRDIAWQTRRAATGKWQEFARSVLPSIERYINLGTWKRQIGDLIEFNAVWKLHEDENYSDTLSRADALMASRKTLRDFRQNEPGRRFGVKKSTLDGGRESAWLSKVPHEAIKYGVNENEELDSISIVKRLFLKVATKNEALFARPQSFKSVCDIAYLSYPAWLSGDPKRETRVDDYLQKVRLECKQIEIVRPDLVHLREARLFYARRIEDFIDEYAPKHIDAALKNQTVENIQIKLEELMKALRIQPSPYYAFLIADGDQMGQQLKQLRSREAHFNFSKHLSAFSKQATQIINEHQGVLVYSGGDDVMAYLPVNQCLDAAKALRSSFRATLNEARAPEAPAPSLSVGIIIVHMLEPLEEVRSLALTAEQAAKKQRDRIAVLVQKRSGGDLQRVLLADEEYFDSVKHIRLLRKAYLGNKFSAQFAYALRSLYDEYQFKLSLHQSSLSEPELQFRIEQEVQRLIRKKLTNNDSSGKPTEDSLPLYTLLLQTLQSQHLSSEPLERLKQTAEQLILSIMLEKEGKPHENEFAD